MKVALCLFGNAGYKQKLAGNDPSNLDSYDLTIPIESIKDNIAKPHNADVFIHSWSKEHSNLINKVFEPISAIYEEPRNFSRHVEHKKNFIQSRWYSEYQSNKLKKIYEKENGFNYDVVVHSRLYVIWFNKIILNNKDETLFVSHWNKTLNDNKLGPFDKENVYQGYALHDWWFYGSSDTMDNLSKVYKHKYLLYFQNKRTWNAHRFPYLKAVNQKSNIEFVHFRGFDFELYRRYIRDGWTNEEI